MCMAAMGEKVHWIICQERDQCSGRFLQGRVTCLVIKSEIINIHRHMKCLQKIEMSHILLRSPSYDFHSRHAIVQADGVL